MTRKDKVIAVLCLVGIVVAIGVLWWKMGVFS